MPDVTSRHHRIVGAFRAARQRESDLVLLDGWHLLHEAAAAGLDVPLVAIALPPPRDDDARLIEGLRRRADVITVSPAVMRALSPVRTPSGVAALARPRTASIDDLISPSPALVVVALDVQDPGNAGAIVRTAEAGGATGVLLAGESADPWGWKALRAAMGSTFRLPVVRDADRRGSLDALRRAGLTLVAAIPRGGTAFDHVDLTRPSALIIGGEGPGLPDDLLAAADERVSIPMRAPVESLNVAVAAALLVYEAGRQRRA